MPNAKRQTATRKTNPAKHARSVEIASRGIRSSTDFADLMASLMSDILTGAVDPQLAGAACNAGGKLLKVVQLEATLSNGRPFNLTRG